MFDHLRKAVHELEEVVKDGGPLAGTALGVIEGLIEVTQELAQSAIDEATEAGSDPKEIAKAIAEMEKAAAELADGDYDKVVKHHKKAWQHGMKAMKKIDEVDPL